MDVLLSGAEDHEISEKYTYRRSQMKTLGILGSSRPEGNTEILLDIALAKAVSEGGQTSKVILRDMNFNTK